MIDWRIVLGALSGGLALACWLESRHQRQQLHTGKMRWLQGTAVFLTATAVGLFLYADSHPLWQQVVAAPFVGDETAVSSSSIRTPALAPPSVFIMATPPPQATLTPAAASPIANESYLHIPALNVSQPVVELPLANGRWDVSTLGEKVGRLDGTGAQPGNTLAPVFAGHMTFPTSATLETGAFANLQYATYGTEIIYEVNGRATAYTVTEISRVEPSEVERLFLEDGDSILLVTCTDWDENGRVYANRLLVRAVRQR